MIIRKRNLSPVNSVSFGGQLINILTIDLIRREKVYTFDITCSTNKSIVRFPRIFTRGNTNVNWVLTINSYL